MNHPETQKLDEESLAVEDARIHEAYKKRSEDDFLLFVKGLKIQYGSSRYGKRFHEVAADFQVECFEDLAPNIMALRDGEKPDTQRFWIERTKKASKDADLGAIVMWLVAFPVRPFLGEIGAADSAQAAIIQQRVSALLQYNPWLNDHVEIISSPYCIRSKRKRKDGKSMAVVNILASDSSGGAHGSTPDLLILNELTHIKNSWGFVDDCMNNADGVPDGVVIVATNAGFKGTKAEVMRNNAIESDTWHHHIYSRPAPWHDTKVIEDAKRRNPISAYNRLWWGKWVSGKGDALNEEDIDWCFQLDGPAAREVGWQYVMGFDLGVRHDHSAIVVLGANRRDGKIKVVNKRSWKPVDGKDIDLQSVSDCLLEWNREYQPDSVFGDPTEAHLMMQQLAMRGVPIIEMSFSKTSNLDLMANTLIQALEAHMVLSYDDDEGTLRRDFGKFTIEEKRYGFRLEATRDEFGHADEGTAFVIALPRAVALVGGFPGDLQEDEEMVFDGDTIKPEDYDSMEDQELRELIEQELSWG